MVGKFSFVYKSMQQRWKQQNSPSVKRVVKIVELNLLMPVFMSNKHIHSRICAALDRWKLTTRTSKP